jgi:hypothetical protein
MRCEGELSAETSSKNHDSTRPESKGLFAIKSATQSGQWFSQFATAPGSFDNRLVGLAEFQPPIYDDPVHPRLEQYEKDHTKAWSETVAGAVPMSSCWRSTTISRRHSW